MKSLNRNTDILIVGLGLLGGSYAAALKSAGFTSVRGLSDDSASVDYALKKEIIDSGYTEVNQEYIASAELIVFALYPHVFLDWIRRFGAYIRPGTLVTDVTGVKSSIIAPVQELLPKGVEFIAAHPMAGREVSGVENSDPTIFHGANYIVVPTERNREESIAVCEELGRFLGFERISRLSPREHDEMIAFLSQLTHCLAVSLMCANANPHLVDYTGDSFRDLTRIARINENMWSELFLLNREALLREMDAFLDSFLHLRGCLVEGNIEGLKEMMRLSTLRRSKFDKQEGPR